MSVNSIIPNLMSINGRSTDSDSSIESNYIFLAYSRHDYKAAEKLHKILVSNGIRVWYDVINISAYDNIENQLTNAISNSKVVIALYSKWTLKSEWFKKELEFAKEKKIPIIKVLTDTPDGLDGERRMAFGANLLEMSHIRFEEKLLSSILNKKYQANTTGLCVYGKELYDKAFINNNLQEEETAFNILLRAAELGDDEALYYIEHKPWNINLSEAISKYVPINSYYVEDMRACLYNKGVILAEDESVSDNTQRGKGMEMAAYMMMKRALDLGYDGEDPCCLTWYFINNEDFEVCLNGMGASARIKKMEKNGTSENSENKIRYDIFLSSKSEDYPIAEEVYEYLRNNGFTVFAASKELDKIGEAKYADAIDEALDSTKHMIVIASSVEHIKSKWVHYEWSTFRNDLNSGYREGNLITILKGVILRDLPAGLRHQQSFNVDSYKDGRILEFLK